MSRRDALGRLVPTARWDAATRAQAEAIVTAALGDLGEAGDERLSRLGATMSLHRAARPDEVAASPGWWRAAPSVHIFGAPIEIIRESRPGALSTRPCADPVRRRIDPLLTDPDLWYPVDCGVCPSCRARKGL